MVCSMFRHNRIAEIELVIDFLLVTKIIFFLFLFILIRWKTTTFQQKFTTFCIIMEHHQWCLSMIIIIEMQINKNYFLLRLKKKTHTQIRCLELVFFFEMWFFIQFYVNAFMIRFRSMILRWHNCFIIIVIVSFWSRKSIIINKWFTATSFKIYDLNCIQLNDFKSTFTLQVFLKVSYLHNIIIKRCNIRCSFTLK